MIEADKLTVIFRRGPFRKPIVALQRFSIQVQQGDIFGLLGPNGAGKSTALYCLLGLIRPNHGSVRVLGESPQPGSALFEGVAYVPEEPHYHLYLTVEEAVSYYGSLYRHEVSKMKVNEAIQRVGLTEFRDLKVSRCSKGMKQKVGIATCLLTTPRLVFLDEPTRGLDPVMTREFREMLLDLNRQGSTIFINSHILSEVESVCNRVAIMQRGRVLAQDEMTRLLRTDSDSYAVECDAAANL
ncbi:MAG: multidrug ABC transporter ATP-binding protein, partial [Acidobacteria bacterium]